MCQDVSFLLNANIFANLKRVCLAYLIKYSTVSRIKLKSFCFPSLFLDGICWHPYELGAKFMIIIIVCRDCHSQTLRNIDQI